MFLFPNALIDLATIGIVSSITGDDALFYPNFAALKGGYRFQEDLKSLQIHNFSIQQRRRQQWLQVQQAQAPSRLVPLSRLVRLESIQGRRSPSFLSATRLPLVVCPSRSGHHPIEHHNCCRHWTNTSNS